MLPDTLTTETEQRGTQITAFGDSWHWSDPAENALKELIYKNPGKVDDEVRAMLGIVGKSPMGAYLVMMASRLVELHRVSSQLDPTQVREPDKLIELGWINNA